MNADYPAYRDGAFTLPRSEAYQLGFRVAATCGHDRLHPIDEWGRLYGSWDEIAAHCVKLLGLADGE